MATGTKCQRSGILLFHNTTHLDDARLQAMCLEPLAGWRLDGLAVRVRYSRGAEFSGSCYYATRRIFVNLGRHLVYPYRMGTHLARARGDARSWWKPVYTIELQDACQVVLFVFLHECYHLLVRRARRNPRQKESMCDRFAARVLVDHWGAAVHDEQGRPAPRQAWDFQDLDGFVAAARRQPRRPAARRARPPGPEPATQPGSPACGAQLLLFPL